MEHVDRSSLRLSSRPPGATRPFVPQGLWDGVDGVLRPPGGPTLPGRRYLPRMGGEGRPSI